MKYLLLIVMLTAQPDGEPSMSQLSPIEYVTLDDCRYGGITRVNEFVRKRPDYQVYDFLAHDESQWRNTNQVFFRCLPVSQ